MGGRPPFEPEGPSFRIGRRPEGQPGFHRSIPGGKGGGNRGHIGSNRMDADDFADAWPWKELVSLEETLRCPICGEMMQSATVMPNCSHNCA
eukprot:scaffold626_cov337-Pavlova_lutheri.AAC.19